MEPDMNYEGDTSMVGEDIEADETIQLRGGKKVRYGNPENLRKDLGFESIQAMKDFVWSYEFWAPFSDYAMKWIWPQQKEIVAQGGTRGPGKRLETVQIRLLSGQGDGDMRYSNRYADTSGWDIVDYQARLLYTLRDFNMNSADGLFYGKRISENEVDSRLWNLWKWVEYNEAPSRRTKKSKDTEMALRNAAQTTNPLAGVLGERPAHHSQRPKIYLRFPAHLVTSSTEITVESADKALNIPVRPDEVQPPKVDDDEFDILDAEGTIGANKTLTNGQIMALENQSQTPNMEYRWWQAWAGMEGKKVRDGENFVAEQDPVRRFEELGIDFETARNEEPELDPLTAEMDDLHLATNKSPEQAAKDFRQTQNYLNSTDYQRENLEDSCHAMGIRWEGENTVYRIPGMKQAWTLRFWQVVGICALLDFQISGEIGACILGDVVGLGKTWMVIGVLLVVSFFTFCNRLHFFCLNPLADGIASYLQPKASNTNHK